MMSLFSLPTPNAARLGNFVETVMLEGKNYQLQFLYNAREGAWYMDVLDVAGNVLRAGLKLVVNWPLLVRWKEASRPPGELVCVDTHDTPVDPALADLGVSALMNYFEAADLA